jgi:hypothetical protein
MWHNSWLSTQYIAIIAIRERMHMAYDERDYKVEPAGPPCTPSKKGCSGNPRGRSKMKLPLTPDRCAERTGLGHDRRRMSQERRGSPGERRARPRPRLLCRCRYQSARRPAHAQRFRGQRRPHRRLSRGAARSGEPIGLARARSPASVPPRIDGGEVRSYACNRGCRHGLLDRVPIGTE